MTTRRSVSLEPIVDMIDVQVKRLRKLRELQGANKARVDLALEALGKARKTCTDDCFDFFINPFPRGKPPGKPPGKPK